MKRTTIDYGIDLGTTNSTIAVLNGTAPEVVQSQEPGEFGSVVTPSAIWFDKRSRQYVGLKARENYFGYEDWECSPPVIGEDSGALEFKLRMGQTWRKPFRFINRDLSPEEMSAEVLKTLRRHVQTGKGEEVSASVVTVPAAFELPQCEATRRAAELAGFSASPLLLEPVAAALAYGFQSTSNKVFWLVYDFGGGTFDAAVVQVRDGVIQVVNHAGDNYLGGKNIDWDIVERLLVPAFADEHGVDPDWLTRSNEDIHARYILNRLKYSAEEAKINVSNTRRPSMITVYRLRLPDTKAVVDFEYELTPQAVQEIITPWVAQSISLCKKALAEKRLSGRDMEKVILVGGTSLFPWLQERVAVELGAKLDRSIDPITVVARGAAVFAGTLRLDTSTTPVAAGTYGIQLEYDSVGGATNPEVVGRITPPPGGASPADLSVEIVEQRGTWRSGSMRLGPDGAFLIEVRAEKGRKCEFQIILTDARGTRLPCAPDRFTYTVGLPPASTPLTHNLGVAMANNKPAWFFRKGEPLPARTTGPFETTTPLDKSKPYSDKNMIRIPIIEGTNEQRADRNHEIGRLEIRPDDPRVKRDVPVGSEVEVTLVVDESRITATKAFVPMLEEEFDNVIWLGYENRSPEELAQELQAEEERLAWLRAKAESLDDRRAKAALAVIDEGQILDQVRRTVAAAQGDPGRRGEADKKLLDLRAAVDTVEDALEWPALVEEARRQMEAARAEVENHGKPEEKKRLRSLAADAEAAIEEERAPTLRATIDRMRDLGAQVALRRPKPWVDYLGDLQQQRGDMTDQAAADHLFRQAQRAIESEDLEALKPAVRQLISLLPPEAQEAARSRGGFGSTIIAQ